MALSHQHGSSSSSHERRGLASWHCRRVARADRRRGSRGAACLLVLLSVMGSVTPGAALCEDRCQRVVPMLSHLRALWSRSFKRVGEKRVSFEEFMVSLVQASSNTGHSRAHRLGNALLNLMGQYQDCVMACEHPFSKRSAGSTPYEHPFSKRRPGIATYEHVFSKRRGGTAPCEYAFIKRIADATPSPASSSLKILCERIHGQAHTSPLLQKLCRTCRP